MSGDRTPGSIPEVGVGDHVAARSHLGGILRPTVQRGTAGIVIARTPDGTLHVAFATGPTLKLDPLDVRPLDDDDSV